MNEFNTFFKSLLKNSNLSLEKDLDIKEIGFIISRINEFFYTNYKGIGYTEALDSKFEYFSEFHKFWERYHKDIINPKIDESKCEKVAERLHDIYKRFGSTPFSELYDTHGLTGENLCKIRYFSANQDFRGSRNFEKLALKFKEDPTIFDKQNIHDNPEDFLKEIGITSLSQNDKRVKYAVTAAEILINNNIEPFNLLEFCNNDISQVRSMLIENKGSGFGNKKTDMFLRDMVVLDVWDQPINFEKIDVASDINTIKVALRTGIIQIDIVLVSSFLDIFCYQYGLMDEVNALAWRRVWEIWHNKYSEECVKSPCLMDYLIYRVIGREFCKESLYIFKCESCGRTFKWHSGRNKTCQLCFKEGVKNKANVIKRTLPCMDPDGNVSIIQNEFVSGQNPLFSGLEECFFCNICNPQSADFKKLNPPKSISILGQTGWDSARVRGEEGGGGLMS